MRIYDTSPLTTYPSLGLPYKPGTMVFLQEAFTEMLCAIAQGSTTILSNTSYSATTPYVVYGLAQTTTSTQNFAAGAIYYNGSLYLSPAISLSYPLSVGQDYIATVSTSYYIDPTADPVTMSDGVTSVNVHKIQTIEWSIGTSGSGLFGHASLQYMGVINTILSDITSIDSSISTLNSEVSTLTSEVSTLTTEVNTLLTNLTVGSWQAPTLSGSWTQSSGSTVRYQANGVNYTSTYDVQLQGTVQYSGNPLATPGTTTTIFTLPSGFRPSQQIYFNCPCLQSGLDGYSTIVSISTAGVVGFAAPGTTGSISFLDLSPIRFTTL